MNKVNVENKLPLTKFDVIIILFIIMALAALTIFAIIASPTTFSF